MLEKAKPFVERTDAKLRYAKVHLNELKNYLNNSSGDDFERAHQESFLFHLFGARDYFLQELNIYYKCNLDIDKVRFRSLKKAMGNKISDYPELACIESLERDENSWLNLAKEMRDHVTHRTNISRMFYLGGENNRKVHLRKPNPKDLVSGDLITTDVPDLFSEWLEKMTELINKLRADVVARIT